MIERCRLGATPVATLAIVALGCGARSSLDPDTSAAADGAGGGAATSSTAAGTGGDRPVCTSDDPMTWTAEYDRDDGDYERFAVATSGAPWVALKVRDAGVVFVSLSITPEGRIAITDRFDLPDSPVYPVAFDVSDTRFALLTTTGINWNGDVELWSIDRATGAVVRVPVGDPPADPAYTVGSALGLVGGDGVALGYSRLVDGDGTVELRDASLAVTVSMPVASTTFNAVHVSPSAVDLYVGAATVIHFEPGSAIESARDPTWTPMGGLEGSLVSYGSTIRLSRGDEVWDGPWPHTQISPPAVVRESDAGVAFTLETELTAVLGYPRAGALQWMEIEPTLEASGLGVGMLPVVEDGRLGFFYLGLEIPMPQQPLRYFGRACR